MKGELWLLLSDQGYSFGLHCVPRTFSHTFLVALCHIDLNVSVEGKIINANSLAVQPTNKTCVIHQADIAIKTTLFPLSHFSPSFSTFFHLTLLLLTYGPLLSFSFLLSSPFCVQKLIAWISGRRFMFLQILVEFYQSHPFKVGANIITKHPKQCLFLSFFYS